MIGQHADTNREYSTAWGVGLRLGTIVVAVALLAVAVLAAGGAVAQEEGPAVEITDAPGSAMVGEPVSFEANTIGFEATAEGVSWSVVGEEGNFAYGTTADRVFDEPGTYTVVVEAYPPEGPPETDEVTVEVSEPNPAVTIDYSPSSPEVGETVSFDAVTSGFPEGPGYFGWQIDGEPVEIGPSSTLEHTFDEPGEYTVAVAAFPYMAASMEYGSEPATDEVTVTVTDENEPPSVDIDHSPSSPVAGDEVHLGADASDPDGDVESYDWKIQGRSFTGGQSLEFTFGSSGDYTVEVTVTDDDGETATDRETVTVVEPNAPPTVGDVGLVPCDPDCNGEPALASTNETVTVSFEKYERVEPVAPDASDDDGEVTGYVWEIDGEVVSGAESFVHTFDSSGEHEVKLTVTDDDGATATGSRTFDLNALPEVDVDYQPAEPTVGDGVEFTASATDPDGHIEGYDWQVDGKSVATDQTFTYSFESAGDYDVTLIVTDDDGASTDESVSLTAAAENTPPTADISDPAGDPEVGDPVQIEADASDPDGEVTEYRWLVDGEQVATGPTFDHSFESAGEHEITLEVTDDTGEVGSNALTIDVAESTSDGEDGEVADGGLGASTILLVLGVVVVIAVGSAYLYRQQRQ